MPTLDWIGKSAVVNHHRQVPYRLLQCDPKLSAGDPEAGNLLVQGDNLLALKALLPYYAGKVKCIYIDPPYNTGNEGWAYNDNVNSPEIRRWLGDVVGKEGDDLSRHDKWLCMMYPRLALLREFLTEDGAIFISIDDNEVHLLRCIMDEMFGRHNFIAEMIWEGAFKNDARQIGVNHEYILVYARDRQQTPREWSVEKEGVEEVYKEVERLRKKHGRDYDAASQDLSGWFRANKAKPVFGLRRFRFIDDRGAYKEDDPTAPGGRKFDLIHPKSGKVIPLRAHRGWAFDQARFDQMVTEGRISFPTDSSIMVRRYLHETDAATPQSVFYQPARSGSERLTRFMGDRVFDFPKDEQVIQRLVQMGTGVGATDALVLDSFAGSGTTGHAVMAQNKADGGNRRFICIEMDEAICRDVTAERLKRASDGYTNSKGEQVEGLGGGFRFCKLGKPLFDEAGNIGEDVSFSDLAAHVFFTETGSPIPKRPRKDCPLLGVHQGKAIYLLFNGVLGDKRPDGGNVLTRAVLAGLPEHDGPKIVYGESCRLSASTLKRANVTFKQLPYDVKVE